MQPNRLRLAVIAAWLGVIALSLDALVPIQLACALAINLAAARECGHYEGATARRYSGWWALALLTGQDETANPSHFHKGFHPSVGAVGAAFRAPVGFTPATAAALPIPAHPEKPRLPVVVAENEALPKPSAYRSRAPPSRTADVR